MTWLIGQATEAAEAVLAEHWNDSVPIDPARLAAKLNIEVVDAYLDADVSGAIQKVDGRTQIFLSATDGANRKRFTCAHEIGHFIKHREAGDDFDYIDYRDGTASQGVDEEERYANAFAAALLMPETHVVKFHGYGWSEAELARKFGVSKAAIVNRLKNLGLYR